ncbi:MAG: CDP-alcohol phosphatidyltransferase family protein [Planctomycetota bacterium]|jgi:CDP-L-myo-inositol myo-inositolphosphotransferase
MTNVALILVTDPQKSLEDHAGLPLLKRTVLSAQRGGIEEFIIVDASSDERLRTFLADDVRISPHIQWAENGNLSDILNERPFEPIMLIKAEVVFDSDIITKMAQPELGNTAARVAVRNEAGKSGAVQYILKVNGDDVIYCSGRTLNQTDENSQASNPADTIKAQTAGLILARPNTLKNIVTKVNNGRIGLCDIVEYVLLTGTVKAVDVTNELCMEITSQETLNESKNKLYGLLTLPSDSLFSIYVSRKFSRLVSGTLVSLPITPNQITLLSFFIGIMACWFFLQGGYWYSVIGVMVLYASTILDLSDGEVARLKLTSSRYGAFLDTISDGTVFGGVLFCTALAIHRDSGMPHIVTVGAIAAVVVFTCSNLYFYLHDVREDPESDPANSVLRSFANEDTFYLSLLGFTLFDGLTWYLWAVAIGTTAYLLVLIMDIVKSQEPDK